MFRDALYAFRTFRRAPLAVFTIVTTVAVGLGLVAVVFTFFNIFLFRVDEVRNPGELFAVERPRTGGGERVRFTRPQYEALQRETAVFTDAFAMLADLDSRIDGRMMAGTLVTGNFFQVLGVSASLGRALTPDDDHRASGRPVLVLSHRGWSRLYATDPDVLDRTLLVNGLPFGVVGVMPEGFLLPGRTFAVVGVTRDVAGFRLADFEEAGVYVPTSAAAAETSLTVRVHGDPELARRALLERLTAIDPNMGQVMTMRTVARLETYLLQIAFWLTMVLGGLALALTLSGLFGVLSYLVEQRTKEIGVCLALGATSRDVGMLVLSQSGRPVAFGMLAGAGLAAALAIGLLSTPAAAAIGGIVRVLDPVAYIGSLLAIVIACAGAALIPALRAARVDPIATLRQE